MVSSCAQQPTCQHRSASEHTITYIAACGGSRDPGTLSLHTGGCNFPANTGGAEGSELHCLQSPAWLLLDRASSKSPSLVITPQVVANGNKGDCDPFADLGGRDEDELDTNEGGLRSLTGLGYAVSQVHFHLN